MCLPKNIYHLLPRIYINLFLFFCGQMVEEYCELLKENRILVVLIFSNCSQKLQPQIRLNLPVHQTTDKDKSNMELKRD